MGDLSPDYTIYRIVGNFSGKNRKSKRSNTKIKITNLRKNTMCDYGRVVKSILTVNFGFMN